MNRTTESRLDSYRGLDDGIAMRLAISFISGAAGAATALALERLIG